MANKNPSPATRFGSGQMHNPGGKPVNARNKISNAFMTAFAKDFEQHGVTVIEQVRISSPEKYLSIAASLLPKELSVEGNVEHTHEHTHEHIAVQEVAGRIAELLSERADSDSAGVVLN